MALVSIAGNCFTFLDSTENPGICTSACAFPLLIVRTTPNACAMNRSARFQLPPRCLAGIAAFLSARVRQYECFVTGQHHFRFGWRGLRYHLASFAPGVLPGVIFGIAHHF
jgi:hypothetical protein